MNPTPEAPAELVNYVAETLIHEHDMAVLAIARYREIEEQGNLKQANLTPLSLGRFAMMVRKGQAVKRRLQK